MARSRVQADPGVLCVKRLSDGRRQLVRDLLVDVSRNADGKDVVTIPKGFVTDYSTLPWGTRWLVHWSRVDVAGVVHDYLYRCGDKVPEHYTKAEADTIWRWIALAGDRRAWRYQGWLAWLALRLFGWCAFRRKNEWAYTPRPTASESCARGSTLKLACMLVPVGVVLGVLSLGVGVLPLLRPIFHWIEAVLVPSVPLRPVLILLCVVAVVLWVLPGTASRKRR